MGYESDIKKAEKSLGITSNRKPRKPRKPRLNPRKLEAGKAITVKIPVEIHEFIENSLGKGWKKSDIITAGLTMIYILENGGELPDIDGKNFAYRPWEGDTIADYKCRVINKRRIRDHKKPPLDILPGKILATNKRPGKPFNSLDIIGDQYAWE